MWENLQVAFLVLVVGMTGVLTSLYFLSVVIWLFKKADSYLESRKEKSSHSGADFFIDHQIDLDENAPSLEEVAAIAGAILRTYFSSTARIKKVKFLNESSNNSWSNQGRSGIMSSHNFDRSVK